MSTLASASTGEVDADMAKIAIGGGSRVKTVGRGERRACPNTFTRREMEGYAENDAVVRRLIDAT